MLKFLKYPYVFFPNLKGRSFTLISFAIYIASCLYFLSNLGINEIRPDFSLKVSIYGVVLVVILLGSNYLIIKFNKNCFNEDFWTIEKEFKWVFANILTIGIFNAIFATSNEYKAISKIDILEFEVLTMFLGTILMFLIVIYNEARWRKLYHNKAEKLNAKLNSFSKVHKLKSSEMDDSILIQISNENLNTPLHLDDLIYIHSDKSGFEMYTSEFNVVSNTYVHTDLHSIHSTLFNNEELMQCHPSFIVNINKVIHVTGNARGYKLHLKNTNTQVPVSMKYKKAFERMIV